MLLLLLFYLSALPRIHGERHLIRHLVLLRHWLLSNHSKRSRVPSVLTKLQNFPALGSILWSFFFSYCWNFLLEATGYSKVDVQSSTKAVSCSFERSFKAQCLWIVAAYISKWNPTLQVISGSVFCAGSPTLIYGWDQSQVRLCQHHSKREWSSNADWNCTSY